MPQLCGALALAAFLSSGPTGAQPVNPNASPQSAVLLAYLQKLSKQPQLRIISGQLIGTVDGYGINGDDNATEGYRNYIQKLTDLSGKTVALAGANFSRLQYCLPQNKRNEPLRAVTLNCNGSPPDYSSAVRLLTEHWQNGGLVSVIWQAPNPWTGGNSHDLAMDGDFFDLYNPGSPLFIRWHQMLDELSVGLDGLQKQGVVVLFRPFPEQNGHWFWWGDHGAEGRPTKQEFVSLWRDTFLYLTEVKKLNNLLWIFCVNQDDSGRDMLARDPGQSFYDIVGTDLYLGAPERRVNFEPFKSIDKPFAITEFGPKDRYEEDPKTKNKFDFERLFKYANMEPRPAFFMAWNGAHRDQALIQNLHAVELLNDERVLSAEDLLKEKSLLRSK